MRIVEKLASRSLPFLILAATVVMTAGMIIWYAISYYGEHRELLKYEAQVFQRVLDTQADTILVRLKDASTFIQGGLEDGIQDRLRTSSRTSMYMEDFGYFRTGRPRDVKMFFGSNVLAHATDADLQWLTTFLDETPGLVHSIGTKTRPTLFTARGDGTVFMAQAMPLSARSSERIVVFTTVELKELVEDAARQLKRNLPNQIRYQAGGIPSAYTFETTGTWLNAFVTPKILTVSVSFTRDLNVVVDLEERFEGLSKLITMITGLLTIGVIGGGMALALQRSRRKSEMELRSALRQAQNANQAKSVFLANMSHEIRTPLNGVLGMAELLGRTSLSEAQRRYATQIKSSGSLLLSILNDILDLSKIESGQLAIDPIDVRLPTLLNEIVSFYSASAQNHGIDLLIDLDPNLPEQVLVDPTRLRQILSNLLSNALKFTKDGQVIVSASVQKYNPKIHRCIIDFSVSDTGIGISDQNIAKLFSRFMQAEDSTTRIYGGTGLGLAICKEICEMMGGTIGVVSQEGQGSTFSFSLMLNVVEEADMSAKPPLRAAVVTASKTLSQIVSKGLEPRDIACVTFEATDDIAQKMRRDQLESGRFHVLMIDEGSHIDQAVAMLRSIEADPALAGIRSIILASQQANVKYTSFSHAVVKPIDCRFLHETIRRLTDTSDPAEKAVTRKVDSRKISFDGLRTLLVDDNNVNLLFGQELLDELGFDVTTAANGAKAIELAKAQPFDVILMDCQMPVMDGYEATTRLRRLMAEGALPRVPIVAVTANALKGDREKCLATGMDAFITKPISPGDLESVLQALPNLGRKLSQDRPKPAEQAPAISQTPTISAHSAASGSTMSDSRNIGATPDRNAVAAPAVPASAPTPVILAAGAAPLAAVAPTRDERPKTPLVDVVAFKQTRASIKKFDTLVSFYSTDTATYLAAIREAVAMRRIEEAVLPAHTIKSSSRIIGAAGLARLAEDFEMRARNGGVSQIRELEALRVHMDRIFVLTLDAVNKLMQEDAQARSA